MRPVVIAFACIWTLCLPAGYAQAGPEAKAPYAPQCAACGYACKCGGRCVCEKAGPEAPTDPELATVYITREWARPEAHRGEQPPGSGSGAVVSACATASLVLTNKHVGPDASIRYTVRAAGKAYPAEWVRASESSDLALLRVKAALPVVELAESEPAPGAPVRLFGYGGPPRQGKVVGRVEGRILGVGDCWSISCLPDGGSSGCPVIDADGRLVALAWGVSWRVPGGQGMAVRLSEVKAFLESK